MFCRKLCLGFAFDVLGNGVTVFSEDDSVNNNEQPCEILNFQRLQTFYLKCKISD